MVTTYPTISGHYIPLNQWSLHTPQSVVTTYPSISGHYIPLNQWSLHTLIEVRLHRQEVAGLPGREVREGQGSVAGHVTGGGAGPCTHSVQQLHQQLPLQHGHSHRPSTLGAYTELLEQCMYVCMVLGSVISNMLHSCDRLIQPLRESHSVLADLSLRDKFCGHCKQATDLGSEMSEQKHCVTWVLRVEVRTAVARDISLSTVAVCSSNTAVRWEASPAR